MFGRPVLPRCCWIAVWVAAPCRLLALLPVIASVCSLSGVPDVHSVLGHNTAVVVSPIAHPSCVSISIFKHMLSSQIAAGVAVCSKVSPPLPPGLMCLPVLLDREKATFASPLTPPPHPCMLIHLHPTLSTTTHSATLHSLLSHIVAVCCCLTSTDAAAGHLHNPTGGSPGVQQARTDKE